jgi:hypothetical protein
MPTIYRRCSAPGHVVHVDGRQDRGVTVVQNLPDGPGPRLRECPASRWRTQRVPGLNCPLLLLCAGSLAHGGKPLHLAPRFEDGHDKGEAECQE